MTHRKDTRQDNSGKQWTKQEVDRLQKLAKGNTPTGLIADALGRTQHAVYNKAAEKNVSLKPTNQSPYNRRGKK
jgi:hypothetical protein